MLGCFVSQDKRVSALRNRSELFPTSTHWGNYWLETQDGKLKAVHPDSHDANPSAIGQSLLDTRDPNVRVARPAIRKGYLRDGLKSDGTARGREAFVEVPWDEALDIAAQAIGQTVSSFGNEAIFGGSYGWSSAGRFHHAQSQLHRFLNYAGGYSYSIQSYSTGTAQIILPHVLGTPALQLMREAPTIEDVARNTKLVVSFGGISMKNMQINQGGIGNHSARDQLTAMREAGVDVVCVSPVRDDVAEFIGASWWPVRPNADVALMLGLAHTLHSEKLHDERFLQSHCTGYERFAEYLVGQTDGIPKSAAWASKLCDIEAGQIRALARRMASESCLLSISWSLQRTEHGDQPYWMVTVLSAMLGNLGLPGQGVGFGYGCLHNFGFAGRRPMPFKAAALDQGRNAVSQYIPVARIADMLLDPGGQYPFNGDIRTYPDIKLVYWAGGNPFHHHQDLNRLRQAWARPQTVIVNEPYWTATARHADIVFPTTTALEREDFAFGTSDFTMSPMHQVLEAYGQSRDDFDVFSGLAARLGCDEGFTAKRSPRQWLETMWSETVERGREQGLVLPDFETFWNNGGYRAPVSELPEQLFTLERFRADPVAHPLGTPSGKVEIFSEKIASFGLPDCAGHPVWNDKQEFLGAERSRQFPLALNSNQPVTRLHSQLDFGATSVQAKRQGREVVRINPDDASAREVKPGDIVRVFNDRGATLASARLDAGVRPGVIVLPTGAWFDPSGDDGLEVHGNPNVLTRDVGTSTLCQGTSAHSCLVELERFDRPLPAISVFRPPSIE